MRVRQNSIRVLGCDSTYWFSPPLKRNPVQAFPSPFIKLRRSACEINQSQVQETNTFADLPKAVAAIVTTTDDPNNAADQNASGSAEKGAVRQLLEDPSGNELSNKIEEQPEMFNKRGLEQPLVLYESKRRNCSESTKDGKQEEKWINKFKWERKKKRKHFHIPRERKLMDQKITKGMEIAPASASLCRTIDHLNEEKPKSSDEKMEEDMKIAPPTDAIHFTIDLPVVMSDEKREEIKTAPISGSICRKKILNKEKPKRSYEKRKDIKTAPISVSICRKKNLNEEKTKRSYKKRDQDTKTAHISASICRKRGLNKEKPKSSDEKREEDMSIAPPTGAILCLTVDQPAVERSDEKREEIKTAPISASICRKTYLRSKSSDEKREVMTNINSTVPISASICRKTYLRPKRSDEKREVMTNINSIAPISASICRKTYLRPERSDENREVTKSAPLSASISIIDLTEERPKRNASNKSTGLNVADSDFYYYSGFGHSRMGKYTSGSNNGKGVKGVGDQNEPASIKNIIDLVGDSTGVKSSNSNTKGEKKIIKVPADQRKAAEN